MPTEIEQLYREHRAGLVRLVERELHDHHDAEDVVQTAFLDAQRALERGTTPRNPHAWLATIALNAGRRLRRRHLNAELLEDYPAQEASGIPELRAALASLPREQRAAVVYRDLLGLSYDETAEQMGKSVNAVTMLLHRGRGRLRQLLGVTAGGLGLSRWLRRAGLPQVAVAKGTAAVLLAAGLATTGVVAARVIAPIGTAEGAAAPARSGSPTSPSRRAESRSTPSPPPSVRTSSRADATSASAPSSTRKAAASLLPSTLGVPTVPLPTVSIPTSPATVSVTTPVATVTVTTPTSTSAAVTTPITTVTVPVP